MKAFVLKITILITLVVSIITILWQCPGMYTTEYAAAVNKLDMLKKQNPPRIVLIGGSNILKINSRAIEKQLPYSVVNLGLWYGISYKYYLEEITPHLKPGDVVVLIIEYHAYHANRTDAINHETEQIIFMSSPLKRFIQYTVQCRISDGLKAFVEVTQQRTKTALQNIRSGNWSKLAQIGLQDYNKVYNDRGELLLQWPVKRPLPILPIQYAEDIGKKWAFLNDFYDYCKKNNVRVFLSFSPLPNEQFAGKHDAIQAINNSLINTMKIPILGKPEDFIFPEIYFTDSASHLNSDGEKIRTKRLLQFLTLSLSNN